MTHLNGLFRRVDALTWRLLGCDAAFAGYLLAVQLWLGLLWFFYQGFGVTRGIILGGLVAALFLLRFGARSPLAAISAGALSLTMLLRGLLIAAVLLDLGMMAVSSTKSFETTKIPMDEGQTSWRAARLLWKGEDPYGAGTLVDLTALRLRTAQRKQAGIPSLPSGPAMAQALTRYDKNLDRKIRTTLLPVSAHRSAARERELRLYGYKYGPVILVATALLAPTGLPGTVLLLNGLVCFGLFAANWRILKRISGRQLALAGAAMLALLLDRHITRNYIDRSATDVWALLFGSFAVLSFLSRRPFATAWAVALAIGCKTMPGLLFLPLVLFFRSPRLVLAFAGMMLVLISPWLLWDASGFVNNVFLWPLYMTADSTSWEFFTPHWVALAARVAAAGIVAVLWWRFLCGKEPRLFWTLAMSAALILFASGYLRNGYIPWISLWAVAAGVEAFASPRAMWITAVAPAIASASLHAAEIPQ
ncbi:MAG TPA: hypothetical protein VGL35_00895 [Rhizomicrobium sp.]|jgi:hypothetical protein